MSVRPSYTLSLACCALFLACYALSWTGACQCAPCPPCADGEVCVEGACLRACSLDEDCAGVGICVRAYCEPGNRRNMVLDGGVMPDGALPRDVSGAVDTALRSDAADGPDRAALDAGIHDLPVLDSAAFDTTSLDTTSLDTARPDIAVADAAMPDAHLPDVLQLDSGVPDLRQPDTSSPDAGGGLDGAFPDGFICYPPGDAAIPADAAGAMYCGEPRIEVIIYDQFLRDEAGLAVFANGACVTLIGDLTISGTGFTSLEGLRKLQQVTGTLTIEDNSCLRDLHGLIALWRVGTIRIENNLSLQVLGLSNLSLVTQDLIIRGNPALGSAAAQQLADQVVAAGEEVVELNGP